MKIFSSIASLLIGFSLLTSTAFAANMSAYNMDIVYTGFGLAEVNYASDFVELEPMVATLPSETHAGLVVSDESLTGDYEISVTVENLAQLRENSSPNPWEAPWLVFGYNDVTNSQGNPDQTFTYVILKPDRYGLELGEALPEDDQTFLWTSHLGDDSFDVGVAYDLTVRVENGAITVTVDGDEKFTFNNENNRQTLSLNGRFGFYTEDAAVRFSGLEVTDLNTTTSPNTSSNTSVNNTSNNPVPGAQTHNPTGKQEYVKRAYNPPKQHTPEYQYAMSGKERREWKQQFLYGKEFRNQALTQRAMSKFYSSYFTQSHYGPSYEMPPYFWRHRYNRYNHLYTR